MSLNICWIENALINENYEGRKIGFKNISKPEASQSCHHFKNFKFLRLNSGLFMWKDCHMKIFLESKFYPY